MERRPQQQPQHPSTASSFAPAHDALPADDESNLPSLRQLFPQHVRMEAARHALLQQQQQQQRHNQQQQYQQHPHTTQNSHQAQQLPQGSTDMQRGQSPYGQISMLQYAAQQLASENSSSPPTSQLSPQHVSSSAPAHLYQYPVTMPQQQHQSAYGPVSGPSQGMHMNPPVPAPAPTRPMPAREADSSSKYDCPYCGKRFDRPSSVKIHITSHTGEKPYVCAYPGCGRRFSVNSNMRRHLRTHVPHQSSLTATSEPMDGDDDDQSSGSPSASRKPAHPRRSISTSRAPPPSQSPSTQPALQSVSSQPQPSSQAIGQSGFSSGQFQLSSAPVAAQPVQYHQHHQLSQQHPTQHSQQYGQNQGNYGGYTTQQQQQQYTGYTQPDADSSRWYGQQTQSHGGGHRPG
ncbi:hypothetical protein BKA62DRAFT_710078 [Auriculariales sp. MPI-PUGE-AT-0066]|nr:hypothetical protein BKA62DRAFT_710078 [Auriculariales sp. MPI-PUGE-AT-0066]